MIHMIYLGFWCVLMLLYYITDQGCVAMYYECGCDCFMHWCRLNLVMLFLCGSRATPEPDLFFILIVLANQMSDLIREYS